MKTTLNQLLLHLLLVFVVLFIHTFAKAQEKKEWNTPSEYKTMKNPVKKTDKSLELGKDQYARYCAACHGKTGKGDGEKAKNFANITPANLALDKFMNETDGEHFYKIKIGRDNLHSFKGKVDDEAIWSIIHYIKTFK